MLTNFVLELFDRLPTPCLFLNHDQTVIYANLQAGQHIHRHNNLATGLGGCSIHHTDLTDQLRSGELTRAFTKLKSCNSQVEHVESRSVQRSARRSTRLRPLHERAASDGSSLCWTLTSIHLRTELHYCLTAQTELPSPDAVRSPEEELELMKSVTKPSWEGVDYIATVSNHDLSLRHTNAFFQKTAKRMADSIDQSQDWRVYDADFTRRLSISESAAASALAAGNGKLGVLQGLEDPETGERAIADTNVVLVNHPFSDESLGCLTQARPPQEWSSHLLLQDFINQGDSVQDTGKKHAPMVRTVLLDGKEDYFSQSWLRFCDEHAETW